MMYRLSYLICQLYLWFNLICLSICRVYMRQEPTNADYQFKWIPCRFGWLDSLKIYKSEECLIINQCEHTYTTFLCTVFYIRLKLKHKANINIMYLFQSINPMISSPTVNHDHFSSSWLNLIQWLWLSGEIWPSKYKIKRTYWM